MCVRFTHLKIDCTAKTAPGALLFRGSLYSVDYFALLPAVLDNRSEVLEPNENSKPLLAVASLSGEEGPAIMNKQVSLNRIY